MSDPLGPVDAQILARIRKTLDTGPRWLDPVYPRVASVLWRTSCCRVASIREEPERHCPSCGKIATWSRSTLDGGFEYICPVQLVEPSPVVTVTSDGGWVRCGHCGWTELLLTARWQMASQWPGVICPSCRVGYLRPSLRPTSQPERG